MRNSDNPIVILVYLLAMIGLLVAADTASAQSSYTIDSDSKFSIDGTSTRSDWTVEATEIEGTFEVNGDDAAPTGVSSGRLTVESANIKSGKSTIMDRLMHDALMVDEHPEISYELTEAEPTGATAEDGSFSLTTSGKLTMTGTTRDVQIEVLATRLDDGKIRFTGSYPMKMSEFGMSPPTAMFGQLRTGDDITVHFDIVAAPAG